KDKKYIFLEGSFNPEFIKLKGSYLLICVHADRSVREQRLLNRKQPELASQDMENFALSLKQKTLELGGTIIDSSAKTSFVIAAEIIKLILPFEK
ncbi:MAG: acetyltransferase, partial [Pseudomonadota bacterium]